MATPQDYLNLVAALKAQPTNPGLRLQLEKMLEAQPELADTNPKDPSRYYRHNTVMAQWPADFIQPHTEAELVSMLEARKNHYTSFRAMGDGYGFANAAATTGCLVQMSAMNDLLPLEAENFRSQNDAGDDLDENDYVRFEGGITFGKLNDSLAMTGQTVWQQPGYRNLTVAGCASAGGHGSGLTLTGISGFIAAVELVNFDAHKNVRVMRIEPKDGLTNPAKYKASHDAQHVLVQDDLLFHAARCGQGHLGIISALTLKRRDKYVLQEDRYLSNWDAAWQQLPQLFANPATHSVHVWINPYLNGNPSPTVLITHLTFTNQPPWGVRGTGILFGGKNVLTDLAGALLGSNPGKGIDSALAMCAKMGVRLKSTEALDFGPPNELAVSAASVGFDASKGDAVMKQLIPLIESWKANGNFVTSPIGMRWVKASEDFLSPQYKRDTIMLEMPILAPVIGSDTSKNRETLDLYANFMIDTFGGRPHWGQQNPMTRAQFEKNYADGIPSFAKAFKQLNPLGLFDGPLTQQLGLRDIANAIT
jgi:hypothetical protein